MWFRRECLPLYILKQEDEQMYEIMNVLSDEEIVKRLESFLFVHTEPLREAELIELLNLQSVVELDYPTDLLNKKYLSMDSSLQVLKAAGAYRLGLRAEMHSIVERFKVRHEVRLSAASMETLAVVAYKQPITKVEIEGIRGVKIDKTLQTLLDFSLIKEAGRKQVVGRPILYETTREFLLKFGLDSLADLPTIPEDFFEKHIV